MLIIESLYTLLTSWQVASWLLRDCNKLLVCFIVPVETAIVQFLVIQYLFNDLFCVEMRVFYAIVEREFVTTY